jgi:hypothetical protein
MAAWATAGVAGTGYATNDQERSRQRNCFGQASRQPRRPVLYDFVRVQPPRLSGRSFGRFLLQIPGDPPVTEVTEKLFVQIGLSRAVVATSKQSAA